MAIIDSLVAKLSFDFDDKALKEFDDGMKKASKAVAVIAAGAVVTKTVADFELWLGNPAKHVGYVTELGDILDLKLKSKKTGMEYLK